MTLPDGRAIAYSNDANGNRTSLVTPAGHAHQFAFNSLNLMSSYTPPAVSGGGPTTYSYDADRRLTSVVRPDGVTLQYGYDSGGRLSSLQLPAGTIQYNYDGSTGHLTSEVIAGGEELDWTYTGTVKTSETWKGQVAGFVSKSFDNNFWMTSLSLNGGAKVAFGYDNDGLMTSAGAMAITRSGTDASVTGSTLGAVADAWTYSGFGEPATHIVQTNGSTLYSAAWTFDNMARVSALKETVGQTTDNYTYSYDASGQLSSVTQNGTAIASYTYDGDSNWQSVTTSSGTSSATVDAQDRLLAYGNLAFTYTPNGEIFTQTNGSQVTNYTYDALGNLTAVMLPDGTTLGYIVDSQNRRVGVTVSGALTTGYLWDESQLVAQLDANNNVVSQFVWATRRNIPDYMISNGVTYRIVSDAVGSPRLVVNTSTGAVVQQMDYGPFGDVISDTNPGFQPFGFAGGLYDPKTKLVRFGARDYDPAIGRWTARDPALFLSGDVNLYAYASNDPVNEVDKNGLCPTLDDLIQQAKQWVQDNHDKAKVGPVTVDVGKGQMYVGTSQKVASYGDQTVLEVTAQVGGEVSQGNNPEDVVTGWVKFGLQFPLLTKLPVIGDWFKSPSHGAEVHVGINKQVVEDLTKGICLADGEVTGQGCHQVVTNE